MSYTFSWKDVLQLTDNEDYENPYCVIESFKRLQQLGPAGDEYEIVGRFDTSNNVDKWLCDLTGENVFFSKYFREYLSYDEDNDFSISYNEWTRRCQTSLPDISHFSKMTYRQLKELESSEFNVCFLDY